LSDLPLRGVRNRSPAERWRKWRRRRPQTLRLFNMAVAVVLAAAALLVVAATHLAGRREEARAALEAGQRLRESGRPGTAAAAFQRGLALAEGLPFQRGLAKELAGQLQRARNEEVLGLVDQGRGEREAGRLGDALATFRRG